MLQTPVTYYFSMVNIFLRFTDYKGEKNVIMYSSKSP